MMTTTERVWAYVSRRRGASFREIGTAVGLLSLSTVSHHLLKLARLGYLRLPEGRKTRAIVVLVPLMPLREQLRDTKPWNGGHPND